MERWRNAVICPKKHGGARFILRQHSCLCRYPTPSPAPTRDSHHKAVLDAYERASFCLSAPERRPPGFIKLWDAQEEGSMRSDTRIRRSRVTGTSTAPRHC